MFYHKHRQHTQVHPKSLKKVIFVLILDLFTALGLLYVYHLVLPVELDILITHCHISQYHLLLHLNPYTKVIIHTSLRQVKVLTGPPSHLGPS